MKLKQSPEDFKVKEVISISISKDKGEYRVYLLEKTGLETFALIRYLAKANNIPVAAFGIAGLKDKHASTEQHFTIPSKHDIKTLREPNFRISFLGFTSKPIKLGDLEGNRFEITVRAIRKGELDGIAQKSKAIGETGVPNYFDSQRFGSAVHGQFLIKDIMKGDYEGAVKLFLTQYTKFESAKVKDEKRRLLSNWDKVANLDTRNHPYSAVLDEFRSSKSWAAAYRRIPGELREMFVSAYQSYLWNECVKELLRKKLDTRYLYTIEYALGYLVYYKRADKAQLESLPKAFSTISDEMQSDAAEKDIIEKVLKKEGITLADFSIKAGTGNFFKSHKREVLLVPKDVVVSEPDIDEMNDKGKNNMFKVKVSFVLPKGSYATVVTKRIFNQ